jgi:hypothetical protein
MRSLPETFESGVLRPFGTVVVEKTGCAKAQKARMLRMHCKIFLDRMIGTSPEYHISTKWLVPLRGAVPALGQLRKSAIKESFVLKSFPFL